MPRNCMSMHEIITIPNYHGGYCELQPDDVQKSKLTRKFETIAISECDITAYNAR